MRCELVTVSLPAELRTFVQQKAEREDRSVAGVIRRLVADARRADERGQSAEAQR
jgi:CopG-like RHH_1 or ribbon-helix-helix domain, RHH_5